MLDMALIGNPYSGTTTLFNRLTGGFSHQGDFSAADAALREGLMKGQHHINIVRFPGLYSLSPQKDEGLFLRQLLLRRKPDVIINVMDFTAIERSLSLTLQLMELELPMVLALNMTDEGTPIDPRALSARLSLPVVPISAKKGTGLEDLIRCGLQAAAARKRSAGISGCQKDGSVSAEKARQAVIREICRACIARPCDLAKRQIRSTRLDKVLTNRILAIPIFLSVMLSVFYLTFHSVGACLNHLLSFAIDGIVVRISYGLLSLGVNPAFHALVVDGICAGVGSVLSFLPQIAVLFFCLAFLEDSGYMPRVAFIMDKLMTKLGLSGASVVPMLLGFGCSVPAILATRSLPSRRDRFFTILLIPFLSCSAKLPIYTIFAAAFFSEHQSLIMAAVYGSGILMGILCACILKRTLYRGGPAPMLLVLPPYRLPTMQNLLLVTWENVRGFVKKAFTVIFMGAVIVWFLQSFAFPLIPVESSEASMLASLGKWVAPVLTPLGFGDWRAATALIAGLSAKEAIVSTLAVLTGTAGNLPLNAMLAEIFTPLSAFSFMIFCLLYVPCIASMAAIRREMGGWRYAFCILLFQILIAWAAAFLVFQGGSFLFPLLSAL